MALFRAKTIEQALIRTWMTGQGVTREMLLSVEQLGRARLRVIWTTGGRTVMYYDGRAVRALEER